MEKNIQDKITALEAAINSPATPENIKETMRKALDTLRNGKVDDDKEINSIIMKLISYKLNSDNYNDADYNNNFEKLLSFDENKVISHVRDFIQKNQNDVSLFEGQNKIHAQEFINRLFELISELKYEFNTRNNKSVKTYKTIKSCLLDDGDDSDDYIYEGKLIHNVEVLPKDTWEIVEFYNYGVVLKHIPVSVLADSKPNKNVSLDELKSLFASDKIEIEGIEKGNTKVFNLCVKAIIKCIDSLDMAAYKENLLAELNASKNELEKTIEASNLLESEKNAILSEKSNLEKESAEKISNLEKQSAEKIQNLESDISAKSISMQEAKAIQEAETARLKKQLEDLDALNSMRTLIDMLTDDIAKKDLKDIPVYDSNGKIKVKSITVHAAEGKSEGYGFPKTFSSYDEANEALIPVLEDSISANGYNAAVNFTVVFNDGQDYQGTVFVSEKRSNPRLGNAIGKHIKSYLDFELSGNRQNEESKKEIREFLEKYDLGLDEYSLDEKNPKHKVGDILLHEYMGEKQKAKILAVTGWTGDGHRYDIEFVDKNNNGIGKFAKSYDDILSKDNGDYKDVYAFVDYVNDFYGKDGIYAEDFANHGFTKREIKEAVNKYISDIDKRDDDNFTWGGGDSVDRERVRQYLQPNGLKFNDGDFVFANMDSRDPKSKTPFVISHYSNGKYYVLGDGSHYVSEDKLSLATEKDFDDYYTELGFDKKAIDSYKNIKYSNGGELKVPYQEIITHTKGEIDLTKSRDDFAKEFAELYGKQNKKRVTPKTIEYFRNDSGSYHTVRYVLEDIETNDFNDVISVFKKVYPIASNDWKEALRTGLLVKAEKREGNYYNKPYIYNEPIAVKIREARLDNLKPLIEEILSDDKYKKGGNIGQVYLYEPVIDSLRYNEPTVTWDKGYYDVVKESENHYIIKKQGVDVTATEFGVDAKGNDNSWIKLDKKRFKNDSYENQLVSESLYKIRFDGALGEGLYFVAEANSPKEAKDIFYREMSSTDKIKAEPEKTTQSFIGYVKKIEKNKYSKVGAVKGVRENIVLKANEILGVDSSFHFVSDNEFTIEPMSEDEKFNGMALNLFPDGTYEVAEFLAGEDGKDLYIFGNYKSLVPALKSLALGNSSTGRKPIKIEKFENGGSINDKITSKAQHEVDFLTKKGYDIDVYSTLNRDAIFGGEKIEDFIIATQGSVGKGKDVKFAIAYWYKDDEDGEMQISRALLDEISDLFKGSPVVLYTNAGVDLHSIAKGKHKNIEVVKVPYGEFSGNSDEYENGGEVVKELKGYQVNIYKSSDSDSPINVVSNKFKRITLVTDGVKGDSSTVMSNEPYIKLVKKIFSGEEYLYAEPVNFGVDKASKMFGGNFVWNSDSRFREYVSERPIPLHDRVESYEKGGKLKGSWGQTFPEVGRTGMYKGAEVIVTANRAGDILFNELDENEKIVKSDKASISEFRSYFRPFEPRETDVIYEKGGFIFNENAEMVLNQNHQIKHHTEELGSMVNEKTHVPAWVVSKVSDAANDLSDATHYLDGENNKMENGGEVSSILKEFNELTSVNNHDDAAILLAEHYGTDEEVSKLKRIQREHDKKGYISKEDQDFRDTVSNKYYYRLKGILNIDGISMSRLKSEFAKDPEIFNGIVVTRGSNQFKIDGEFLYIKESDSDWRKFRKINSDR
jgi:hypothetical protein